MSSERLVGSLLPVALSELLAESDDLGFEPVDLVVAVFDALMLGIVAGSLGDGERWAGVSVPRDFKVKVGMAVEPVSDTPAASATVIMASGRPNRRPNAYARTVSGDRSIPAK